MNDRPVRDQETDPRYNLEPGLVMDPRTVAELAPFEQFPSRYTVGSQPGNPYTYRPYPKMLYKAMRHPATGKIECMAARPNPADYDDYQKAEAAAVRAQQFTDGCQTIVKSEEERSRAWESGYRDSPKEAIEAAQAREDAISRATAERNWEDRNMSAAAKRESEAVVQAEGGAHQPEITPQAVRKTRGRRRTA